VFQQILQSLVPIFVLVMIGYSLRRLGVIGGKGTDWLSKLVLLYLFPVLVFLRMATTGDSHLIIQDWPIMAWSPVMMIGSAFIGWAWYRFKRLQSDFRTFVYLVGMPNWIYLPLAVVGPIWGDEAVRMVILFNIPTQVLLWTAGIALLKGELRGTGSLRYMLTSPGLIATMLGLLVCFGVIPLSLREGQPGFNLQPVVPVLTLIGNFTVPLSLVALGLYLGEKLTEGQEIMVDVLHVAFGRLLLAPAIVISLVILFAWLGFGQNALIRHVVYLIAVMPVAVSVPLFAAMFGRDRFLASRSVVISTMAGFVTAPLMVLLALKIEQWLGLI